VRRQYFFSGADIGEFSGPPKEAEYRALFARFEGLDVPVVAAMHGTVMGGGLEIALACHYRVAAPGTRFGLPEVTLGIIPGAGGTQRMPRLIGVEKTLELVLGAKPVDTAAAMQTGFLDAVIEGELQAGAIAYLGSLIASGKGPRRTGSLSVDPATATPDVIERFAKLAAKQYPNRQAPLTAIEAITAATRLPFAAGLEYETELVNQAKLTVESRGAVHVFFAERATRKVPGIPADLPSLPVKQAAVIGSGTMGGGIAICFANAGIPVHIVDTGAEALERGMKVIGQTYDSMVKRGRITPEDKARRMGLINRHTRLCGSGQCGCHHRSRLRKHGAEAEHPCKARQGGKEGRNPGDQHVRRSISIRSLTGSQHPENVHRHALFFRRQRHAVA